MLVARGEAVDEARRYFQGSSAQVRLESDAAGRYRRDRPQERLLT